MSWEMSLKVYLKICLKALHILISAKFKVKELECESWFGSKSIALEEASKSLWPKSPPFFCPWTRRNPLTYPQTPAHWGVWESRHLISPSLLIVGLACIVGLCSLACDMNCIVCSPSFLYSFKMLQFLDVSLWEKLLSTHLSDFWVSSLFASVLWPYFLYPTLYPHFCLSAGRLFSNTILDESS